MQWNIYSQVFIYSEWSNKNTNQQHWIITVRLLPNKPWNIPWARGSAENGRLVLLFRCLTIYVLQFVQIHQISNNAQFMLSTNWSVILRSEKVHRNFFLAANVTFVSVGQCRNSRRATDQVDDESAVSVSLDSEGKKILRLSVSVPKSTVLDDPHKPCTSLKKCHNLLCRRR